MIIFVILSTNISTEAYSVLNCHAAPAIQLNIKINNSFFFPHFVQETSNEFQNGYVVYDKNSACSENTIVIAYM